MAEGMTTRQKETVQLQKELEKLDLKLENTTNQLRAEMRSRLETLGSDIRKSFEQFMLKFEASGKTMRIEEPSGDGVAEVMVKSAKVDESNKLNPVVFERGADSEVSRFSTKYTKLECPKFDGSDFQGWLLKMEQFFEVDQTREEDKIRTIMMHLEGKALQWHQRYMKSQGKPSDVNWTIYVDEMRGRFSENEYSDPMLEIVSLKHISSVEEFYEEFEGLLNLL